MDRYAEILRALGRIERELVEIRNVASSTGERESEI